MPAQLIEDPLIGAVERKPVVAFPNRLPRPEIGGQIPPRRTGTEPPRDPLQNQPMIGEPVSPPTHIRGHQRIDRGPQLIRNHSHRVIGPIVAATPQIIGRHALGTFSPSAGR